EKIPVVPMYFAKKREMIERDGQLIPTEGLIQLRDNEKPEKIMCRFRTLGCYPCTGAIRSDADTVEKIVEELMITRQSERITRIIDHDTDGSMELKKREGYF
ncbi:MAG: sulfate adenylyltransferase subunit CysD, partial [Candidatus Latescibacteria bacterium]|nr:sulfate adenylyltransferase subunit CysD [Candidatus Latescibacterota bacterium]